MVFFTFFLAAFALSVNGQGKWEFYAFNGLSGALSYGRLDPIISPGAVSAHVHMIHGANAMQASYDYDTLRAQSTCSTLQVQDDLSNYWAPAMYHYDGASNYSLMLSNFHIYYQFATYSYDPNNIDGSSQRYPFPKGLKMLAGDMYQRNINGSDPNSYASVFQCQRSDGSNSPYSHDIRDFQKSGQNCDNTLRATTRFPSCWDGVADNSDLTHVVYPNNLGVCPSSHPMAFMQLLYEWYWPVQSYPFDPTRTDNWVLSFGDTSGFGFHGDFVNGWNITLMESAIAACNVSELSIENCPPFAAYQSAQIPPCMPSGLYPDEPVGLNGKSLTALPGCNPLWTDNSTKPTCPTSTVASPSLDLQLGPDLTAWNYVSCPFSYNSQGPLLTAHERTGWTNMTVDSCLTECAGYKYAMMEWGTNCFCDNQIQNGGSIASDLNYPCQVRCAADYMQFCGGYGSGDLFQACTGSDCHANAAYVATTSVAAPSTTISLTSAIMSSAATVLALSQTGSSSKTTTATVSSGTSTAASGAVTTQFVTVTVTSWVKDTCTCS